MESINPGNSYFFTILKYTTKFSDFKTLKSEKPQKPESPVLQPSNHHTFR